jgi:hypothetical protein
MKRYLWIALGCVGGLCLGILIGFFLPIFRPAEMTTTITSQSILTAMRDQGFLVTQTYVFDQPVTISKSTGSAFKDFFVGQTIEARGSMEANIGVDLSGLGEQDVSVSNGAVTLRVPRPKIFNTRLVGPIDVKNSQGILKRVLEPNDGYNEALTALAQAAETAAAKDEIKQRAENVSIGELQRLVRLLSPGAAVTIEWK